MDRLVEERLQALRVELVRGERRLEALNTERQSVCETMLRISGAIQVLEELEKAGQADAATASG
jgi:hypothetical protein